MNRRDFMRGLALAPLAAVPAVADAEECEPCIIYEEWNEATKAAAKAKWLQERLQMFRARVTEQNEAIMRLVAQIDDAEREIERLRQYEHPGCWPLCPKCFGRPKMEYQAYEWAPWTKEVFAVSWRCPECGYEATMRRDDA